MDPADGILLPPIRSPSTAPDNPRKRGRTACTRCKNRKQKCDNQWPMCSNCRKAGVECDKTAVIEEDTLPAGYTRALEERVAFLEIQLSQMSGRSAEAAQPPPPPSQPAAAKSPSAQHNALGEIVDFLSLGNFEAPAYIGSASGLSLAVNLGEMVQATVFNKAFPNSHDSPGRPSGPDSFSSPGRRPSSSRARGITMEELMANSAEPPSDELGAKMLGAYFSQLHPRYPFLDRAELWRLHAQRMHLRAAKIVELSKEDRFGIFKLYLVYAIGATLLQLTEKRTSLSPESFYMTALQHISAARESRTTQNIEAMTLLVIYHLRSASSHGIWYMIGLAMRTCIDLGLHRKAYEESLDSFTIQRRRRLFWTVYSLERVISISLGRPFSISDRHIDVELPVETDDTLSGQQQQPQHNPSTTTINNICSPPPSPQRPSLSLSVFLVRLRRIESRIHHSIYRADRPLASLRPKMDRIYGELEAWKTDLMHRFAGPDLNYPLLHYHRAVRLLVQPFLSILPPADPYYHICLRAAGEICQTHKRLHQTLDYGHSFIAVQTIFVAGITMLYCLWTSAEKVWSVTLSNDIRACSLVLFVMGERAAWVKKYRDAFEVLVGATMEKLQGEREMGMRGMVETATAQVSGNGGLGGFTGESPGGQDEAMRMVVELANWIDQDGSGSAVWMPDFEMLQNLSSTKQ